MLVGRFGKTCRHDSWTADWPAAGRLGGREVGTGSSRAWGFVSPPMLPPDLGVVNGLVGGELGTKAATVVGDL